ncbi:MAG: GNAT family N-acetyltransferase [Faecalibacterium sp.]|nr:GNAT family N-acetyltransferase [Faecalibacterium sp.]
MFRTMQPQDLPALKALWCETFGDSAEFAETALCSFAGAGNVWVAEAENAPVGMVSAVPVELDGRKGVYLYGLAVAPAFRKRGIARAMVEHLAQTLPQNGVEFMVLIPAEESLFGYYEALGFQKAFARRTLQRPIKRDLWAVAEFDAATAKALCGLRAQFCPHLVQLAPTQMAVVLADLYRQGVTIVSNKGGYGLYFRKGETLHFVELQAVSDAAATTLLSAAREKEVVVEDAVVSVGAVQELFQNEGTRADYGMIRFLSQPFDVSEGYMGLMLDV